MFRHILLLAIALILTACVPPEGGLVKEDVAGSWVLVDGNVEGNDFPFAENHRVTLHLDADGGLGGTAACNTYAGSYDLVASIFEMGAEIAMTTVGCQPEVALAEDTYLSALRLVDSAALIEGGRLHLLGDDADLLFDPLSEVDLAGLVGPWAITRLGGDGAITATLGDPTVEFKADETMTVSTGCRALSGQFVVNGDELLSTELSSSGECTDEMTDQDGHIAEVLGGAFIPVVEDDVLTLTASGGDSLVLKRP